MKKTFGGHEIITFGKQDVQCPKSVLSGQQFGCHPASLWSAVVFIWGSKSVSGNVLNLQLLLIAICLCCIYWRGWRKNGHEKQTSPSPPVSAPLSGQTCRQLSVTPVTLCWAGAIGERLVCLWLLMQRSSTNCSQPISFPTLKPTGGVRHWICTAEPWWQRDMLRDGRFLLWVCTCTACKGFWREKGQRNSAQSCEINLFLLLS